MSDQEVWKFIESQCGAKNVEEFQQLARPEQKVVIFNAHEEGVGPRTLSRLTGVPYTIVQRATSNKDASFISRQHGSVCDSNPDDEEYLTYFDAEDLKEFPDFQADQGPVPLIRKFNRESTIFNLNISEFVKINQVFLIEATAHASKSYLSTKAVFHFEEAIRNAVKIGISKPKADNKNQKPFQDMLIMKYHSEDLGTVKLTIGVRFKSHEKVQYGISVPPAGQPLIDPSLSKTKEGKKKASHRK